MNAKIFLIIFALIILLLVICFLNINLSKGKRIILLSQEMMNIDWYRNPKLISISPDNSQIAIVYANDKEKWGKEYLAINKKIYNYYDEIIDVEFSPDSHKISFIARSSDQWFVIDNGKQERKYKEIKTFLIQRCYMSKCLDNGCKSGLIYSPDSKHLVYIAKKKDQWHIIIDGNESAHYDDIDRVIFSNDSRRLAYIAKKNDKMMIVQDGKEGKLYDKITFFAFSNNSKAFAYSAIESDKTLIAINDKVISIDNNIDNQNKINSIEEINFNLDGTQIAYIIKSQNNAKVVLNSEIIGVYDDAFGIKFSPDDHSIVFIAESTSPKKELNYYLIKNGNKSIAYKDIIFNPIFSPDSQKIAFVAKIHNNLHYPLPNEAIIQNNEVFSLYFNIRAVKYSSDSRYLIYIAQTFRTPMIPYKESLIINNIKGNDYHFIFAIPVGEFFPCSFNTLAAGGSIKFESNNIISYLARKGNKIFLIKEQIVQ